MGAKGFILTLLAVAAAGAGAGYGATFAFPPPETPPATSSLAPDPGWSAGGGADGGAAQGSGGAVFREEDLPEEVRQAMAEDPEMAAQIRQAIESGQIPPGAFGPPGGDGGGFGSGPGFAGGGAAPLTGTVLSFSDGLLRLDTADGEAELAVAPDTPVNVTKAPSGAGEYLAEGAKVTAAAEAGATGALTAFAVFAGDVPDELTQGPGIAAFATIIAGTVESFEDGTLTISGDDGSTAVAVSDQMTIVSASLTAMDAGDELAEGAVVTVFVERGADGGLEAGSIEVGDIGGGFGGLAGGGFGGGFGGGGAFFSGQGGAAGQFPGADALSPEAQQAGEDNRDARIQRRVTRQTLGTGRPRG